MKWCRNKWIGYLLMVFGLALISAMFIPPIILVYILTVILILTGFLIINNC